jgi:hypothetical protein
MSRPKQHYSDNIMLEQSSFAQMVDPNHITKRDQEMPAEKTTKNTQIDQLFQSELINNESTNKLNTPTTRIKLINCGDKDDDASNLSITSNEDDDEDDHNKSLTLSQKNALNYIKNTFNHSASADNNVVNTILYSKNNKRRSTRKSKIDPLLIAEYLKKTEINTNYTNYKKRTWVIDLVIFILVVVNVVLSLIDNEVYIAHSDSYLQDYLAVHNLTKFDIGVLKYMDTRTITFEENLFRFINGGCSIISCILLNFRYKLEIKLLQIDDKLSKYDSIASSGLLSYLILEMLICITFYPPFLNFVISGEMMGLLYVYNLNSIFSVFVMLKLYVFLRIVTYSSRWNSETAVAICNKYRVKSGLQFTVKAEMKKRPSVILTFLLLVSLGLLSFTLRTFEYGIINPINTALKGNNDLSYLANCFWLIIITMTTVGYGDYFPRSHLGRFVGVIACIIGMLLLSLIVVSFSVITEFTQEEKKAFSKLKKLLALTNMENKAANVITTVLLIKKLSMIKAQNKLSERFILFIQLKNQIAIFCDDSRAANSYSIPLDEMLKRLEKKISNDVDTLTKNVNMIQDLDKEIEGLTVAQKSQRKRLTKIIDMQNKIGDYLINLNNANFKIKSENHKANTDVKGALKLPQLPMSVNNSEQEIIFKDMRQLEAKKE